jgi:hypothetical protein
LRAGGPVPSRSESGASDDWANDHTTGY